MVVSDQIRCWGDYCSFVSLWKCLSTPLWQGCSALLSPIGRSADRLNIGLRSLKVDSASNFHPGPLCFCFLFLEPPAVCTTPPQQTSHVKMNRRELVAMPVLIWWGLRDKLWIAQGVICGWCSGTVWWFLKSSLWGAIVQLIVPQVFLASCCFQYKLFLWIPGSERCSFKIVIRRENVRLVHSVSLYCFLWHLSPLCTQNLLHVCLPRKWFVSSFALEISPFFPVKGCCLCFFFNPIKIKGSRIWWTD